MDVQSAAAQLISYLGSNPDKISQFVEHPYSTTASVTGTDERISKEEMSQVVTQVAAQTSGQTVASKDVASVASALMGQTDGSVHALTSALFGGAAGSAASSSAGPSMAEIAAKSVAGGLAARGLATLITTAMGTNANQGAAATPGTQPQGVDLSGLAKLAEGLLKR